MEHIRHRKPTLEEMQKKAEKYGITVERNEDPNDKNTYFNGEKIDLEDIFEDLLR